MIHGCWFLIKCFKGPPPSRIPSQPGDCTAPTIVRIISSTLFWGTLGPLLEHFGVHFGTIVGPCWCFLFCIRFRIDFQSVLLCFWFAFGAHFASILASKIDPGGPWARKGRPSTFNNSIMKINDFGLGGCPGAAKIAPKTAFEIQSDF